jgi:hypothetical protein
LGAFKRLVGKIDSVGLPDSWKISILAVSDGSPSQLDPREGCFGDLEWVRKVEILHLNLDHQRAITVGLAYEAQNHSNAAVVDINSDRGNWKT